MTLASPFCVQALDDQVTERSFLPERRGECEPHSRRGASVSARPFTEAPSQVQRHDETTTALSSSALWSAVRS